MKAIRPPALKKGDTIGIMAPSSRANREKIMAGAETLKKAGYGIYIHPQTWKEDRSSAGTARQKAAALHDLFKNKKVKAIICARAGNLSGTMLPHLDYGLIKRNPKIIMGYSDVTALLNALHEETGLVTFHGPVIQKLAGKKADGKQIRQWLDLLAGEKTEIPASSIKIIRPGLAKGRMVGGNLSLVCSLMGTRWQPDFSGKILFLEDCDDELSRYDRMLRQLANAGAFNQAAGVLFGSFTDSKDTGALSYGFTLEEIIRGTAGNGRTPVIMNAPFGHGKDLYTFPVGGMARIEAKNGKKPSLIIERACAERC
ncbi:MAG: LD-carboxypeptidase [Proteobacteria bacterium]|nr:LD-carboxypeptidase [Pseudomonadota bacterium]